MKPAPAVVVSTAWPFRPATAVLCAWASSMALSLYWLHGPALWLSAGVHGLSLVLFVRSVAQHRPGWLMWTGEGWRVNSGQRPGASQTQVSSQVSLRVGLDLQRAMLVTTSGSDGARWWWVSRGPHPGHWMAWRRAVMAHGQGS